MSKTVNYRHLRSKDHPVDYWIMFEHGKWKCAGTSNHWMEKSSLEECLSQATLAGAAADLQSSEWSLIDLTPPEQKNLRGAN